MENLSEDELAGHVAPLIEDLLASAQDAVAADGSHDLSEAQLATLFSELDGQLDDAAKTLLQRLDVDGKLAQIARNHTELVSLAAVAAVVAWALKTNPDLPEFGTDKDLGGGHSVSANVDLGELLNLTVQHLDAGWSYDGENTDASVTAFGGQSENGGGAFDRWGLGAALSHDGENTDIDLDGRFQRDNGQDTWHLGGSAVHTGEHSTTTLGGRLEQTADGRSGFLSGRHVHEQDQRRRELGGRVNLDGTWSADAGISGLDPANPWSLSAQAGRTSTDPEVDWSVTGKMARQLDDDGRTVLSGQQTLARDRSLSRLQLDHSMGGDHSASAWLERERTANGTIDAIGGSLNTSVLGADAYAKGWMKSNDTWEASAGIQKGTGTDDLSWFAEGFTSKDAIGQQDSGVRAGLRWRF